MKLRKRRADSNLADLGRSATRWRVLRFCAADPELTLAAPPARASGEAGQVVIVWRLPHIRTKHGCRYGSRTGELARVRR
jgi:hypothetical protein